MKIIHVKCGLINGCVLLSSFCWKEPCRYIPKKDKGNTSSEKKDIWLSRKRDLNLDLVSLMMHNRIQAVHNSNKAASPTCGNLWSWGWNVPVKICRTQQVMSKTTHYKLTYYLSSQCKGDIWDNAFKFGRRDWPRTLFQSYMLKMHNHLADQANVFFLTGCCIVTSLRLFNKGTRWFSSFPSRRFSPLAPEVIV